MSRRTGFTILEILVAFAVLTAGVVPVLWMLSGSRTSLGQSQESLRMQLMAQQIFEDARVRVVRGEFADLAGPEEAEVSREASGLRGTVTVVRDPAHWGFELVVTVVSPSRRFAFRASVADAAASFSGLPRPEAFGLDTSDPLWNGAIS